MFRKVLIANRGEIAIRVMRTLREMGIGSVAVYSEADRDSLHARYADEAYCVGPAASRESYLRADRILEVAARTGAEAIHPGYGFLSENKAFAEACAAAGVAFIGPRPYALEMMGEKTAARRLMMQAGVPVVPGTEGPVDSAEEAFAFAKQIGFPVLIKAAAGGGGKGMRRVDDPDRFLEAFDGARREAASSFANDAVYIEKWVLRPKHVEIQVLADAHGNAVHLFERDCSVQRRHQKVVEESPCAILRPDVRAAMGAVGVQAARAVDYLGAGTIEFLLDHEQNFYFIEMNTRLQVEHPVTEMVTGVDLVEQQIRIAAGQPMSISQETLSQRGHAIEVRVYAEDPAKNFLPSPGRITRLDVPTGPGIRNDSGYEAGSTVSLHYDPMVAKFIVHATDRDRAIGRLLRCLDEYVVHGIETNIEFLKDCVRNAEFVGGAYDTGVLAGIQDVEASRPAKSDEERELATVAAAFFAHFEAEARRGTHTAPASAGEGSDMSNWRRVGLTRSLARH